MSAAIPSAIPSAMPRAIPTAIAFRCEIAAMAVLRGHGVHVNGSATATSLLGRPEVQA